MKPPDLKSGITPEATFLNRRFFMKSSLYAGTALTTAGLFRAFAPRREMENTGTDLATVTEEPVYLRPGPGEPPNSFTDISSYNNYYEFSTSKSAVAEKAKNFITDPWKLEVGGLVNNPLTLDLAGLLKFRQVERVYRMRCVEGWSMVIPWRGVPLGDVLKRFEPTSKAKYVAFTSLADPRQMPGVRASVLDWPYREGLRIDEAMHPLTLLATGMYGKALPQQNGAPLRLVVPWKYGFKGIKSIIAITFVERMPKTSWNMSQASEYGFFSNVNPAVDHPRWSQASERRIAGSASKLFAERIPTLPFNGYAAQVASLYAGMDLKKWF